MFEAMLSSLQLLLTPNYLLFIVLGCSLGLGMGLVPGLGGNTGLVLLLPLIFGMEQGKALALMVGMLAPICTADTFPAVLMGVPGTAGSQATVMDGFPLAQKGQAARALSAAFLSSLLGGVISALVLSICILAARPLILAFGFSEQLMLIVLALFMVGSLSGKSLMKGLAACGVGLLLGTIGSAPNTGFPRLTFNTIYLLDGVSVILLGMGVFGIPSIFELLTRGGSISEGSESCSIGSGWKQGVVDVLKNKLLVLKCALVGTFVGFLPGLGGTVVDWISYGFAKSTAKDSSCFGKGDIRGVIAPESANNAKTGGALIPTLLFGIPGSGHMILLLAGFVIIGIEPGLSMVRENLNLTYLIIWTLALSNILGAAACFGLARPVSHITKFNYVYIAPIIISFMFYAAFQVTRGPTDFWMLIALCVLGVYIQRFDWPRSSVIIGFYMSRKLEPLTYQAMSFYGMSFLKKPIVIVILVFIILLVISTYRSRRKSDSRISQENENTKKIPQIVFASILLSFVVYYLFSLQGTEKLTFLFPMIVGIPTILMLVYMIGVMIYSKKPNVFFGDNYHINKPTSFRRTNEYYLLWMLGFILSTYIVGFLISTFLFNFLFVFFNSNEREIDGKGMKPDSMQDNSRKIGQKVLHGNRKLTFRCTVISSVVTCIMYFLSVVVNMEFPSGFLF